MELSVAHSITLASGEGRHRQTSIKEDGRDVPLGGGGLACLRLRAHLKECIQDTFSHVRVHRRKMPRGKGADGPCVTVPIQPPHPQARAETLEGWPSLR